MTDRLPGGTRLREKETAMGRTQRNQLAAEAEQPPPSVAFQTSELLHQSSKKPVCFDCAKENNYSNPEHTMNHHHKHHHHSHDAATINVYHVPPSFLCPLSRQFMDDPVVDGCAHTFERSAIVEWLRTRGPCCPISRKPLRESDLRPNHALGERMDKWKWEQEFLLHPTSPTRQPPQPQQSPSVATGDDLEAARPIPTAPPKATDAEPSKQQERPVDDEEEGQDDDDRSRSSTCRSSGSDEDDAEADGGFDMWRGGGRRWAHRRRRLSPWPRARGGSSSAASSSAGFPPEFLLLPQERQALEWWQARYGREEDLRRRSQCQRRFATTVAILLLLAALGAGANQYHSAIAWFRGGWGWGDAVPPGNNETGGGEPSSSAETTEPPRRR